MPENRCFRLSWPARGSSSNKVMTQRRKANWNTGAPGSSSLMNTSLINAMALPITSRRIALFTVLPDMISAPLGFAPTSELSPCTPPFPKHAPSAHPCDAWTPPSMAPYSFGKGSVQGSLNLVMVSLVVYYYPIK